MKKKTTTNAPRKNKALRGNKGLKNSRRRPQSTTPAPWSPPGYNPMTPSFRGAGALQNTAERHATEALAPQLSSIDSAISSAKGGSERRQADLGAWYGDATAKAEAAAKRASDALGNLLSVSGTTLGNAGNSMEATLKELGSTPNMAMETDPAALLAALGSSEQSLLGGIASAGAPSVGALNEAPANLSVGLTRAREGEAARLQGEVGELGNQKAAAMNSLPSLISQERTRLESREIDKVKAERDYRLAVQQFGEARAGRLFNEWLAEQELGLNRRQQTFQEYLAEWEARNTETSQADQSALGWADLGQRGNEADQAESAEEKKAREEREKLRGEQRQRGADLLASYLAPTMVPKYKEGKKMGERPQKDWEKSKTFDQALQMLRTQAGMGPLDSLYLLRDTLRGMLTPDVPGDPWERWYERARGMINDHLHPGWRERRTEQDIRAGRVARPKGRLDPLPPGATGQLPQTPPDDLPPAPKRKKNKSKKLKRPSGSLQPTPPR